MWGSGTAPQGSSNTLIKKAPATNPAPPGNWQQSFEISKTGYLPAYARESFSGSLALNLSVLHRQLGGWFLNKNRPHSGWFRVTAAGKNSTSGLGGGGPGVRSVGGGHRRGVRASPAAPGRVLQAPQPKRGRRYAGCGSPAEAPPPRSHCSPARPGNGGRGMGRRTGRWTDRRTRPSRQRRAGAGGSPGLRPAGAGGEPGTRALNFPRTRCQVGCFLFDIF